MIFELIGYWRYLPGLSGFFPPLFVRQTGNSLRKSAYYIQLCEDDIIIGFSEIQLDNIGDLVTLANHHQDIDVGYHALHVFALDSSEVIVGDRATVSQHLRSRLSEIATRPAILYDVSIFLRDLARFRDSIVQIYEVDPVRLHAWAASHEYFSLTADFGAEGRSDFLKSQAELERRATDLFYITPFITNALATDDYIRASCAESVKRTGGTSAVSAFEATADVMVSRRDVLLDKLHGGTPVDVYFAKLEPIKNKIHRDRAEYVIDLLHSFENLRLWQLPEDASDSHAMFKFHDFPPSIGVAEATQVQRANAKPGGLSLSMNTKRTSFLELLRARDLASFRESVSVDMLRSVWIGAH